MPSKIKLQIETKAETSLKFPTSIHFHIEPAKAQRPFPPCEVTRCLVASDEKCLELKVCDSEPNDGDVNREITMNSVFTSERCSAEPVNGWHLASPVKICQMQQYKGIYGLIDEIQYCKV